MFLYNMGLAVKSAFYFFLFRRLGCEVKRPYQNQLLKTCMHISSEMSKERFLGENVKEKMPL